jgi:hypothetical protein
MTIVITPMAIQLKAPVFYATPSSKGAHVMFRTAVVVLAAIAALSAEIRKKEKRKTNRNMSRGDGDQLDGTPR